MTITIYILRDPKGKLIKKTRAFRYADCWWQSFPVMPLDFRQRYNYRLPQSIRAARRLGYRIERFKLEVK